MEQQSEIWGRIDGLKAEAKNFRALAKFKREQVAKLKADKDWVGALKASDRVREYVRAAQDRDAAAAEMRARIAAPALSKAQGGAQ